MSKKKKNKKRKTNKKRQTNNVKKTTKKSPQKNVKNKTVKKKNTQKNKVIEKNENKKKENKKVIKSKKNNNILIKIFFTLCIIIFIISGYNIIKWHFDNEKMNKEIKEINDKSKVKKVKDSENTEIIENDIDESDPYWDFIKMNLIDVDFNELKNTNPDTKGWIKLEGTNINYPFVQTNNNDFYLNHTFDKSYNGGGWVFLDYRNNLNNEEKNTIIYAHGRENKTMFGTLKNILTSQWVNNSNNYVVKMSTEYENTLWQVFSVYRIPTTSDYLQIYFSDNEFLSFAQMLINRSNYNFNTSINSNDRILTLSTCYNDNDKVVLHAKLIKRERK